MIKLTEKEIQELKTQAQKKAKAVNKEEYCVITDATVQSIIDQADRIITDNPHLSYKDIEIVYDSEYDGSRDYYFEYKASGEWEPIFEQLKDYALKQKEREYEMFKRLSKKFEGETK